MLQITGLTKRFGSRTLWQDLEMEVGARQMVALTGPSGSGKSTLLNCIGLLEPVSAGRVLFGGVDLVGLRGGRARRFRRDQMGYLFQNYALIDNTSVLRNLLEAVGAKPRRSRPTRADCEQALEQVGLEGRGPDPTYQLSGGEQQRVALARLIVRRPSLVLADEPTGALDHANADMVINTLRDFARAGATVLIATHSDRVVAGCDREFSLV